MPQGPSSTFYTPGAIKSQEENKASFDALFNSLSPSSNGMLFPRLAEGGIVNSATLAMIGEAGPEAVVPLNRMGSMGGTYVTVNISGSVTTERDLVDAITQGIYNNQAAGIPISYSTAY